MYLPDIQIRYSVHSIPIFHPLSPTKLEFLVTKVHNEFHACYLLVGTLSSEEQVWELSCAIKEIFNDELRRFLHSPPSVPDDGPGDGGFCLVCAPMTLMVPDFLWRWTRLTRRRHENGNFRTTKFVGRSAPPPTLGGAAMGGVRAFTRVLITFALRDSFATVDLTPRAGPRW